MATLHFKLPGTPFPVQRGHLKYGGANAHGERVEVNSFYLERNGRPWLPVMGEFQYSRYPEEEWETELLKIKAGGVELLATYSFWIHHEEEEGVFDWSGRRNLRAFLEICRRCGLRVALRIGPFCHGESRNGGLPDWLYGRAFGLRCNAPEYLRYVERYYAEIGRQAAGFLFKDGGPIISIQYENEFMDSVAPWETTQLPALEYTTKGADGVDHLLALRRLAAQGGLESPLPTVTGWGSAPVSETEFLPLYGAYAFHGWVEGAQEPTDSYIFRDAHARHYPKFDTTRVPFASCEMGGGMQVFYRSRPAVPAASVEAMQVVFLGRGTNLIGYYVYHGGSNPVGKRSFLNEHRCPRISYDFQAPIREFGQLAESYHRLRRQFLFLERWGSELAPLGVLMPEGQAPIDPRDAESIRCAVRAGERGGFVFLNNYQDHFDLPDTGSFQIRLSREGKEIVFPHEGELRLRSEGCAIFPFHLDLHGVELLTATAQPLTWLEYDGRAHYFFFVPAGISPEFMFAGGAAVTATTGLEPAWRRMGTGGRQVDISVLDDAQSLRFWKGQLFGAERVVWSDVDIFFRDGNLEIIDEGSGTASLAICPPPQAALTGPFGEMSEGTVEGAFQRYGFRYARAAIPVEIERPSMDCAVVRVPADAFDGLDEILLRIECVGDIGTAHLDGRLIHDYFCHEVPWELGLRRFLPMGRAAEIVLRVSPSVGTKLVAGAMANMQAVGAEGAVARIDTVTARVRRRFPVTLA